MPSPAQTFFDGIAGAFMDGDLVGMASRYSFPCPLVVTDGRPVVVTDAARFSATFAPLRRQLLGRGLLGVTARIGAVEIPRRRRLRAWLRWQFHFQGAVETTPSDSIYYLSQPWGDRLTVEMAECDVIGQAAAAA